MGENKNNIEQMQIENDLLDIQQSGAEKNTFKAPDEKKKQNRVRTRRIAVGATFTALALVGILSIFSGIIRIGMWVFDDTREKEAYSKLLNPLVMYDPLPFESPEEADQRVLLASCLWAAITNEDMTQFEKDEYDQTLLPAAVLDRYYARLFGTTTALTHGTFQDQDVEFVFNEEKQAYVIVATSYPVGYTRKVEKIDGGFNEKIVTVGYLSPQTSWTDTSDGTVTKYVDYIFQKQDGEFYLVAIRDSEMKVEVSSSSDSSAVSQPAA